MNLLEEPVTMHPPPPLPCICPGAPRTHLPLCITTQPPIEPAPGVIALLQRAAEVIKGKRPKAVA